MVPEPFVGFRDGLTVSFAQMFGIMDCFEGMVHSGKLAGLHASLESTIRLDYGARWFCERMRRLQTARRLSACPTALGFPEALYRQSTLTLTKGDFRHKLLKGASCKMTKKILMGIAGIALAIGLFQLPREKSQSRLDDSLTWSTPAIPPPMETVCVESMQNFSRRPVNMESVEDELVSHLQKIGFRGSHRISDPDGKQCDAFLNAELVEVSGRGRKTAKMDFRLTLAGEQPPRISASAVGKSRNVSVSKFAFSFMPAESAQPEQDQVEREAISAAIEQQARQIDAAYKRGLPPWLPSVQ